MYFMGLKIFFILPSSILLESSRLFSLGFIMNLRNEYWIAMFLMDEPLCAKLRFIRRFGQGDRAVVTLPPSQT